MSAAGVRTYKILELLKSLDKNASITYITPQKENSGFARELKPFSEAISIQINDSNLFKEKLQDINPTICVYDTFVSEEFYGWMVHENFPEALKILDTQDLRTLRKFRHKTILNDENISLKDLSHLTPSTNSFEHDLLFREMAAMLRCDLNFIVSTYEYNLLINQFKFPKSKLEIASFFYENPDEIKQLSFDEKLDFFTIGNFNHEPNVDSINYLKQNIWPKIQKKLPKSKLFIYGALPKEKDFQLHSEEENFLIKGELKDLSKIQKHRVQIAPLRFGAGIKGKISDGWYYGIPCVTSFIGSEGMTLKNKFGGEICWNDDEFVKRSIGLYKNEKRWNQKQQNGFEILKNMFNSEINTKTLKTRLENILNNLNNERNEDIYQHVLWNSSMKVTEMKSKYIMEKNKNLVE
eukprot:gene2998-5008_t